MLFLTKLRRKQKIKKLKFASFWIKRRKAKKGDDIFKTCLEVYDSYET